MNLVFLVYEECLIKSIPTSLLPYIIYIVSQGKEFLHFIIDSFMYLGRAMIDKLTKISRREIMSDMGKVDTW